MKKPLELVQKLPRRRLSRLVRQLNTMTLQLRNLRFVQLGKSTNSRLLAKTTTKALVSSRGDAKDREFLFFEFTTDPTGVSRTAIQLVLVFLVVIKVSAVEMP